MPSLLLTAFARAAAAIRNFIADPIAVLHHHYWSAPWLEPKSDLHRDDRV